MKLADPLEFIIILCIRGANKEAQDIDDYTPLLTAAEFGRTECFKRLLQSPRPAAIDVKNKDRKNAVFLAAESNHPDIIEVCTKLLVKSQLYL